MPDRLEAMPGSTRSPFRRGPRRVGLLGTIVVVLLLGGVFLQARILYPMLFLPRGYEPESVVEVNLPARMIRVLRSDGDPRLVMKTPLDDPRADARDRENLDRHLFPDAGPHSYLLLIASAGEDDSVVLDLDGGGPVLTDFAGRTHPPVDLSAALAKRAPELPSWLHLTLSRFVSEPGPILIDPGETRRVLLAYPAGTNLADVRSARLGDRTLEPAEMQKDELDRELVGGPTPPVEDR